MNNDFNKVQQAPQTGDSLDGFEDTSSLERPAHLPKPPTPQPFAALIRRVGKIIPIVGVVMLVLLGGTFLAVRRERKQPANKEGVVNVIEQTLEPQRKLQEALSKQAATRAGAATLQVKSDLQVSGQLRLVNSGGSVIVISPKEGGGDANFSLPGRGGTICLDSNNCNFIDEPVLQSRLAQVRALIAAIPPNPAASLVNGVAGSLVLQGTTNQIAVTTASGVIRLSTPQDLAQISSPTFANLLLSGNLAVGGTFNLPLDCSVFASNGKLTTTATGRVICANDDTSAGGGGIISGSGTANYVARFTGPTSLGTGVLYDNGVSVGIGTSSPNSRLEVISGGIGDGVTITGSTVGAKSPRLGLYDAGTERGALGLAEAPIHYSTDAAIGDIVLRATTGKLLLQTGVGASALAINGGNVGIGTTTPSAKLDVAGNIYLGTGQASSAVVVQGTSQSGRFGIDSTGIFQAADTSGKDISFYTNSGSGIQDRLHITSGGKVGVGTTAPTAKFHVVQPAYSAGSQTAFQIDGAALTGQSASAEATDINFNLARTVQFATGTLATQRAIQISAPTYGFVGASTITDASTLAISGAPITGTNATLTNSYGLKIAAGAVGAATNAYGLFVDAPTGATNNYAAVFASGNVGIGTTTPTNKLTINSLTTSAPASAYQLAVSTGGVNNGGIVIQGVASQGIATRALQIQDSSGTETAAISTAGYIFGVGGFQINNSSSSSGYIVKVAEVDNGGTVNLNDVVVYTSTGGANTKVITTTTARDSRVYGVVISGGSYTAGQLLSVGIGGNGQVNVDTGAVAVGDQLVASATAGRATVDNNATTGIVGIATSSKAAGSNGVVGLIIRPVGGQFSPTFRNAVDSTSAFQIQNAGGTNLLSIDSTVDATNLITNPSFETNTTGWAAVGAASLAQSSAQSYFGTKSLAITTTAAVGDGAKFPVTLSPNTTYRLSFSANYSATASTIKIGRSENGSTELNCSTTNSIGFGSWSVAGCSFTTGASVSGSYIYIEQNDATARTIYIDGVRLVASSNDLAIYNDSRLSLNGSITTPLEVRSLINTTRAFAVQNSVGKDLLVVNTNKQIISANTHTIVNGGNLGVYSSGYTGGLPANLLSVNIPTTADSLATGLLATTAPTNKGLVIQGVAGQIANLFEVQNSTGNGFFVVTGANDFIDTAINNQVGGLRVGGVYNTLIGRFEVVTGATNKIGQIISGASGQTADLFQLQNSSGAVLSRFDSAGQLHLSGAATSSVVFTTRVTGDTNDRLTIAADGQLSFGSGSGIPDAGIYRNNPGVLGVSGRLIVGQATDTGGILSLNALASTSTVAILRGAASQTGDLLLLQDVSGNINAKFGPLGNQLTLGRVAAAGTVTQGKVLFSDGTNSNFGVTLQSAVRTGSGTVTIPNTGSTNDTICLLSLANCGVGGGVGISGSGTLNYVARFTSASTLGIGVLYDNGTNVGINTTTPTSVFHTQGTAGVSSGAVTMTASNGATTFTTAVH